MRTILNCARQSGKSTAVAAKATHKAKHTPGALIMIFAPTENQAVEMMEKISVFMTQDPEIILIRDSTVEKRLINGSRIRAFTSTPKSARGYSDPDIIIIDEAAYVDDELYMTIRPMMNGGKTELVLLSTPNGKNGFFYETWHKDSRIWKKIEVQPPWIMHEVMPEKYDPRTDEEYSLDRLKRGIFGYISPRHKRQFLFEEFEIMEEHWYLQEYGCQFRDPIDAVFDMDLVMAAFGHDIDPMDHPADELIYDDQSEMNDFSEW